MTEAVRKLHQLLGSASRADLVIIYDGQCVFCASYVKLLRLREAVGTVALVDARSPGIASIVKDELGLDLDQGMLVLYAGQAHYGPDAMHVLADLTSNSDRWNALTRFVLRRRWAAKILYPAMKLGRSAALLALYRTRIQS